MKKSIFASKTFWLNVIMGLLAIIVLVDPSILAIFGVDPIKGMTIVGFVTAILNVLLRTITSQGIKTNK